MEGGEALFKGLAESRGQGEEFERELKELIIQGNLRLAGLRMVGGAWRFFVRYLLGLELNWHHEEMWEWLDRYNELMILEPRGFGKTRIIEAWCVWQIVKNRDITIAIVSKSENQARDVVSAIRSYLESEEVEACFGEFKNKDEKWREGKFTVKGRNFVSDVPTVESFGIKGQIVSSHVDIIILDDLVDRKTCDKRWTEYLKGVIFNEILPMRNPGGKLIFIGTRYSPEDIYGWLENAGELKVLKRQALFKEGKRWRSLWEDRFPVEYLLNERKRMGSIAFDAQFQCDVSKMEHEWVQPMWLSEDEVKIDELKYIVMGVDPATGRGESGNAIVVMGEDENNTMWVLDYWYGKSWDKAKRQIKKLRNLWQPQRIIFEGVGFQRELGEVLKREEEINEIKFDEPLGESKESRFLRYVGYFERGDVKLRKGKNWDEFLLQICRFPKFSRDDLVDAVVYCMKELERLRTGRTGEILISTINFI